MKQTPTTSAAAAWALELKSSKAETARSFGTVAISAEDRAGAQSESRRKAMRSAQERMNEELMREERRAGRNMGLFVVFCVVFTLTTATVTIVYPLITGFSN